MTSPRILLCATGLSPQIVTETLYALAVQGDWLPDEIHLITTAEGAALARLSLLDPDEGHFYGLYREYADHGLDLEKIVFDDSTIHVIADAAGQPLGDIRSEADNQAAADGITAVVRQLTADPATAVHASIAGGRKTMGFFLGYAMSLFGRPRDRLSHVLVSAPFESLGEFYFPPRKPRRLQLPRENRYVHTADARITLADIPFVRLRDGLTEFILNGGASFSEAVAQAQRQLGPPRLVLDAATRTAHCGSVAVTLAPVDFAFYAWLVRRLRQGKPGICRNRISAVETAEFLAQYPATDELSGGYERVAQAVGETMEQSYFDSRCSRVNAALRKVLGTIAAQPYQIHSDRRRPRSRYAPKLQPGQVRFGGVED